MCSDPPPGVRHACATSYGIADEKLPLQPHDWNLNIGTSSLLGFALGLRPSKDVLWTMRPENCRGVTAAARTACAGKGAQSNPGSNIELNAIVATLSTGPVSLADKAHATNVTIVRRCARLDGRSLLPLLMSSRRLCSKLLASVVPVPS